MKRCPKCGNLMVKVGILLHRWQCDNCMHKTPIKKEDDSTLDDVLVLPEAELVETEK
jgi:DNA-directed RNA polymerase subunit M/transcription elongation factor TFIIS